MQVDKLTQELKDALEHMVKDAEDPGKKEQFRGFVTQSTIARAKAVLDRFEKETA